MSRVRVPMTLALESVQIELPERRGAQVGDDFSCALRHFLGDRHSSANHAGHRSGEDGMRDVLRGGVMIEAVL